MTRPILFFLALISFNSISADNKIPSLHLKDGVEMPIVGYGTSQANDADLEKALDYALESGYRHIDTATLYNNEKVIGQVLKRWFDSGKLQRKDIFITTKLPPNGNRAGSVEKYLKQSLAFLQLDYVDLYLIHAPFAFKDTKEPYRLTNSTDNMEIDVTNDLISTWKVMERQVEAGLVKAIGVSNFNQTQLQRLLDNSQIKPSNLQVEIHAYLQQNELVDFCKRNNIAVTAYAPLGHPSVAGIFGKNITNLLSNPVVQKIADKHKKTTAQVLLRFTTQRGIAVIPKSVNKERIQQNINIFDFTLDKSDISELKSLDAHLRIFKLGDWIEGLYKHPEFPFKDVVEKIGE